MKTIKQIFGFCEHKWEIKENIDIFDSERRYLERPIYAKCVLQCEKCGDIKVTKV